MNKITEILDERNVAIRDNRFIYARYSINSLAHDLIQLLISQINHMDSYLPVFEITMKQISNSLNYRILKPALIKAQKDLLEKEVFIEGQKPFHICSNFEIQKSPYSIKVEFSDEMKEYLINTSSFTAIKNDIFFKLDNAPAKKLYMAMRNKLDLNFSTKINNAYTISKDNLIKLLGLGDSYSKLHYYNLEREVEKILVKIGSYNWKTKQVININTELAISYSVEVNKSGIAIFKFTTIATEEETDRRVDLKVKKKLDKQAKETAEVERRATYVNNQTITTIQKPGLKAVDEWLSSFMKEDVDTSIIDAEVA